MRWELVIHQAFLVEACTEEEARKLLGARLRAAGARFAQDGLYLVTTARPLYEYDGPPPPAL